MLNATIAGNIGKDAETRQAGSSTVTGFAVAVEQRGKDGKKTQWVNCSMWGSRGDKLVGYLTKGSRVCVSGELTTREYNDKTYLELNVSDVTLMGGGQQQGSGYREHDAPQSGYGAGGRPSQDLEDSIPFAPETRT